jgi:hypothetical protein
MFKTIYFVKDFFYDILSSLQTYKSMKTILE